MGLEADQPVDHVDAGPLQRPGEADVGRLVAAGLELDQGGHLLAPLGGPDERPDDGAVSGGAVQGLLDGQDARVPRRLGDELLHRLREALVGVLDEDVALADGGEDVGRVLLASGQAERLDGVERLVLQLRVVQVVELPQGGVVERVGALVDVLRLDVELADEEGAHLLGHGLVDFEPHRPPEPPPPQLHLDGHQQVVGLLLLEGEVGVARDPERVVALDLHPRKKGLEVGGDHLLQGDPSPAVGQGEEAGEERRDLDPGEAALPAGGVAHDDGEVEREVGDVGEGVPRVHGQRGEHREDPLGEHLPDPLAVGRRQGGPVLQHDAVLGQARAYLADERPPPALQQPLDGGPDGLELVGDGEPVGRGADAGGQLVLEPGHPHLEELVQVLGEDGQELDPLEQAEVPVLGQGQYPAVEVQGGQLAVEIVLTRRAVGREGLLRQRGHLLVLGLAQVPIDQEVLPLGVAVDPLPVAPELRVVRGQQEQPGQGPLAEVLDHRTLTEVRVHPPVRHDGAQVHDADVAARWGFLDLRGLD